MSASGGSPLIALKRTLRTGERLVKRTVEPVWRRGFNAEAAASYRRTPPVLGAEAQRVLETLDRDGVATSTLEALTGDPTLLPRLQALAAELEAAKAETIDERRSQMQAAGRDGKWEKSFLIEFFDTKRPVIEPAGLLAQTGLSSQVKGVADSYFQLRTRITDINIWRNLRTVRPAQSSQLWHRDLPEDYYVLKIFCYLEDVDEGGGPFTYMRGTHTKGDRKLTVAATHDGETWRATDESVEAAGLTPRVSQFTGPAGTVVFADTRGYHRGGWAKTSDRLLLQVLFSSYAAVPSRLLGAPEGVRVSDWDKDLAYDVKTEVPARV